MWSSTHPNAFTEETWVNQRSGEFELKYPDYLRDEQIQYLISNDPRDAEGITSFQTWLAMSSSDSFETADPLLSGNWFSHLWLSWKKLAYNGGKYLNGNAQRQAADDLIIYAFQMRNGAGHVVRPQAPFLVPPDQLISDAVTTMDLPRPWAFYIQGLKSRYLFSWSWYRSIVDSLKPNVITFVFSAEQNYVKVVKRKLIMALYGAQKQRRALRMTDGFVFGSILNNGEMSIYVSYWRNDTLIVEAVFHPFKLEIFGYFVECFFALCKISDFQKKWLEDEFGRWNEAMNVQKKKLFDASESKDVWRDRPDDGPSAPPHKTKRSSADPNVRKVMAEARILAQAIMSNSRRSEIIYFPTKRNIVAFNIVTDAGASERDYQKYYPASWIEEASKRRCEFEDPDPFLPIESGVIVHDDAKASSSRLDTESVSDRTQFDSSSDESGYTLATYDDVPA
ncbi:hypothetical protein A7U60_g1966 [Sanghuangporus baumii]|uniref:Uncharacterized protein n=1 Tax=Sanghuangporus baumii TaxID=108892 RepID=A0A9Q5NB92_SANBA|nr:hypothetical protein A7U60_g1966 [Sanghuangporus baumii]